MRILLFFITFVLISCSESKISVDKTEKIYSESIKLLNNNRGFNSLVEIKDSPLNEMLDFTKGYTTEKGLYLVQKESFASEVGVFIPRIGIKIKAGEEGDPSYKLIFNNVYEYRIEG